MLHECILPAGDDKYCMTEQSFRLFLHWLVDQEANGKEAVADITEDRDLWKVRATAAAEKPSPVGLVLGITAAVLGALGVGFTVGYFTQLGTNSVVR